MAGAGERAIAHVARRAEGGPGDPAWRVTLQFHPDRLAGGVPILRRVTVADLLDNAAYRGREFAALGVSLARGGSLDPALIGAASRSGRHDEQALKRVWHYVARFGSPETRGADGRQATTAG